MKVPGLSNFKEVHVRKLENVKMLRNGTKTRKSSCVNYLWVETLPFGQNVWFMKDGKEMINTNILSWECDI